MCAAVLNGETPDALPAIPPLDVAADAVQATFEVCIPLSSDLCDQCVNCSHSIPYVIVGSLPFLEMFDACLQGARDCAQTTFDQL